MKPTFKSQKNHVMGRRSFLGGAAALGVGAGLSAPAITSPASAQEISDIALRDQDLPFIGVEETFSTPELMALNSINQDHVDFLTEIGLADLGRARIDLMDQAGPTKVSKANFREEIY